MTSVRSSAFVRWVAVACGVVTAVTSLLEHVASLLRVLVSIAGWVVLLVGTSEFLMHPYLAPEHLVTPGVGALAVLQGLVRPPQRPRGGRMATQDEAPEPRPEQQCSMGEVVALPESIGSVGPEAVPRPTLVTPKTEFKQS
jgi:hypothetical protein